MEQKQEIPPRGPSPSTSAPQNKDGPEPAAGQRPGGVLTSSPPQSPVLPAPQAAAEHQMASPEGRDRQASDDQLARAIHEPSHLVPRLLAMTPRRLPPALLSASSQRRGAGHGRLDVDSTFPRIGFPSQAHGDNAVGLGGESQTTQQVRAPGLLLPGETSPTLPPPFSHTPRQVTRDFDAAMVSKAVVAKQRHRTPQLTTVTAYRYCREFRFRGRVSGIWHHTNDTSQDARPTVLPEGNTYPPGSNRQRGEHHLPLISPLLNQMDAQGDGGRTRETSHRHTRSRRVQSSTRRRSNGIPSMPSASSDNGQAEASYSSPTRRMARLQIYNDSLPPWAQPETPQNLPEARHQSYLRGSYTVPARRGSPFDIPTPTTTSRRRQTGSGLNPSPAGLQTPGFLGLYGGIENTDDVQLFEQAQRGFQE